MNINWHHLRIVHNDHSIISKGKWYFLTNLSVISFYQLTKYNKSIVLFTNALILRFIARHPRSFRFCCTHVQWCSRHHAKKLIVFNRSTSPFLIVNRSRYHPFIILVQRWTDGNDGTVTGDPALSVTMVHHWRTMERQRINANDGRTQTERVRVKNFIFCYKIYNCFEDYSNYKLLILSYGMVNGIILILLEKKSKHHKMKLYLLKISTNY